MGPRVSSTPLCFSVLVEQFLTEYQNSGSEDLTISTYAYRLQIFSSWLESTGIPLGEVTRDTIQQWMSDLRTTTSQKTKRPLTKKYIRDIVGAARAFCRWLVAMDKIPKDPFLSIRPVKVPEKVPDVLHAEDVNRLLEAARPGRERVALELLYGSGVRKAELLAIDLDHLDLAGSQVLVHGKGGRERWQPISPQAVEAIRAYLPERSEVLAGGPRPDLRALLVTRQGRMGRQTIQNLVHQVADRIGMDRRVYPHLFRHCFATHLLDGGARLEEVQELLDHQSILTTRLYARVSRQRIRAAYFSAHPRASQWASSALKHPPETPGPSLE